MTNNHLNEIDPDIHHFRGFATSDSSETINCKYYTTVEYNKLANNYGQLLVMTYNIRSFHKHIDEFHSMMQTPRSYPNVLVLTETWFSPDYTDTLCTYSSFHSFRPNRKSGGVSVLIKNTFESRLINEFSLVDDDIEVCTVEARMNNFKFIIVGVYRPNDGNLDNFMTHLQKIFQFTSNHRSKCILLGDLNINLLSETIEVLNFNHFMNSHYFLEYLSIPTRFAKHNLPSLIDHIWYNDTDIHKCGAISIDFTDHTPCFVILKNRVSIDEREQTEISFRLINETNTVNFLSAVRTFDWNELLCEDLNVTFENFSFKLDKFYCNNFPIKTKTVTNKQLSKPWITPELKQLIDRKSQYFELYRLGVITHAENNSFKNTINSKIKRTKADYYKKRFLKLKNNIKSTWSLLSSLMSRGTTKMQINCILHNDIEYSNETDIANIFNRYFNQVADELSDRLPDLPNVDPLDYVSRVEQSMYLFPLTEDELCKHITSIKPKKNSNKNCITVDLFKLATPHFSKFLCKIINKAFSAGLFPDCLKRAIITPILKSGDKRCIHNYRPISVLPFMSKLVEKCLLTRLISFLDKLSIISPHQYGFTKGRSTQDALIAFTDHVYEALDNKQSSISVFVDYSKAFDTVDHAILLAKLEKYGIRGLPQKIFLSYLTNRTQQVKIGKFYSDALTVTKGVPQGSLLGPVFFLLYINDMVKVSSSFTPILYADDTTLLFSNKNEIELQQVCNRSLVQFQNWSIANRLTININKCYYMIITNQRDFPHVSIQISNQELEPAEKVKFLGVFIDNKMKFLQHSVYIASKVSRSIGIMYRVKDILPQFVLQQLYNSLVLPYYTYCITVWGGTFQTHLDRLWKLQKRCIRIVCGKPYLEHTTPLFHTNKILKLQDLYRYQLNLHFYRTKTYVQLSRRHNYSTRNIQNTILPYHRLTTTQHSVAFQGSISWNRLPVDIRSSSSFLIFKKAVKQFYVNQYTN